MEMTICGKRGEKRSNKRAIIHAYTNDNVFDYFIFSLLVCFRGKYSCNSFFSFCPLIFVSSLSLLALVSRFLKTSQYTSSASSISLSTRISKKGDSNERREKKRRKGHGVFGVISHRNSQLAFIVMKILC